MRILVVDDDPAVSGALNRALRLEGYEVTLVGDGLAMAAEQCGCVVVGGDLSAAPVVVVSTSVLGMLRGMVVNDGLTLLPSKPAAGGRYPCVTLSLLCRFLFFIMVMRWRWRPLKKRVSCAKTKITN